MNILASPAHVAALGTAAPKTSVSFSSIVLMSGALHGVAFGCLGLISAPVRAASSEPIASEVAFQVVALDTEQQREEPTALSEEQGALVASQPSDSIEPSPSKLQPRSEAAMEPDANEPIQAPMELAAESETLLNDSDDSLDSMAVDVSVQAGPSDDRPARVVSLAANSTDGREVGARRHVHRTGAVSGGGVGHDARMASMTRGWMKNVGQLLFARAARQYPATARMQRMQGTVALAVTVNQRGLITDVTVKQSSGHDVLDHAALRAVRSIGSVPPPPTQIQWHARAFTLPIVYRLN